MIDFTRARPRDRTAFDVAVQPVGIPATAWFEAIYREHYRDVYRYVVALTRSHEDAEEVTADAFERAFRAWSRGSPPERHLPWLLLTARRIATDRWRRARRGISNLLDPGSEHDLGRTEFWIWFDALATVLTDRQREAIVLRYQRDLSDDEIAAVMGITRSGLRSLVARALEALRAHPELLT